LTLHFHTGDHPYVTFSPDGGQLFLATGGRVIKVFDARPLTPEILAEREALRRLANGSKDREAELATAVADRESKLEILHRRLSAQDAELASLRRSLPRSSLQVQQIYERATAELSAVKAGLRRTASPSQSAPDKASSSSVPTSPVGAGRNPAAVPAPGGASMKASEIEPKKD